jgi:hypothetical protein
LQHSTQRDKQLNKHTTDEYFTIGSGGRARICMEDDSKSTLRHPFMAPGNAGTAEIQLMLLLLLLILKLSKH